MDPEHNMMLYQFFKACLERRVNDVMNLLNRFPDLALCHVHFNNPVKRLEDDHIIGYSALHFAAEYGDVDMARILLACGAKVDLDNGCGMTPLHVAMLYDKEVIFHFLLNNGADINFLCESENAFHLLYILGEHNEDEMLMKWTRILINAGCNINHASFNVRPLSLAPSLARHILQAAGAHT